MSDEFAARAALERMNLRAVAVASQYTALASDLRQMATANPEIEEKKLLARHAELCAAYGMDTPSGVQKPFAFAQGLAIIPVSGTLINRFSSSWGYVTGYNYIQRMTRMAGQDPDVVGIVYDHNSYGGEAAGCFECSESLRELANGKPTLAVIDSNCYSASYAMATAAGKIVCTPSGGAGSIGVVAMHVSMEKMLKNWGIEVTFIFAGEHKVDGNPFESLPDDVRAEIQSDVDASREKFAALVAKHRKMDVKAVKDTEARCYRADDALALGLIDAIATPQQAVQAFLSELSGSNHQRQKESAMTQETQPGASSQATPEQVAADARKAERERMGGIMNCEEAKGKQKLAQHLAMSTSMSVDDAKATLAAAAPEVDPKAAATNGFQQAMDNGNHPNLSPDGKGNGTEELSATEQILRDQELATGRKLLPAKA